MSSSSRSSNPILDTERHAVKTSNSAQRKENEKTASHSVGLQDFILAAVVVCSSLAIWYFWPRPIPDESSSEVELAMAPAAASKKELEKIPFDGAKALEYTKQLCAIGPRVSGTEGMIKQRKLLVDHFKAAGAAVTLQEFPIRHPLTGKNVTMANIIITWYPERMERILLSAHYDTRPFPDEDPRNAKGVFLGANDAASAVALLMELARHMPKLESKYGVDFVLFDGEELVYRDQVVYQQTRQDQGSYFVGSEHFAKDYAAQPPKHSYKWAVNLDMIGGHNLQLPVEPICWGWPESQPLVKEIWGVAAKLGVKEFRNELATKAAQDDHIPLHDIAKIPAIDIIDFDYRHWHTVADKPENCSALSLARVGWVMHEWLKSTK